MGCYPYTTIDFYPKIQNVCLRPRAREGTLRSFVRILSHLGQRKSDKVGYGLWPAVRSDAFNIRLEPTRLLQTACYAVHLARVLLAPD